MGTDGLAPERELGGGEWVEASGLQAAVRAGGPSRGLIQEHGRLTRSVSGSRFPRMPVMCVRCDAQGGWVVGRKDPCLYILASLYIGPVFEECVCISAY